MPGCRILPANWDRKSQSVKGDKMMSLRLQNEMMKYQKLIKKIIALGYAIDLDEIIRSVRSKETSYFALHSWHLKEAHTSLEMLGRYPTILPAYRFLVLLPYQRLNNQWDLGRFPVQIKLGECSFSPNA